MNFYKTYNLRQKFSSFCEQEKMPFTVDNFCRFLESHCMILARIESPEIIGSDFSEHDSQQEIDAFNQALDSWNRKDIPNAQFFPEYQETNQEEYQAPPDDDIDESPDDETFQKLKEKTLSANDTEGIAFMRYIG